MALYFISPFSQTRSHVQGSVWRRSLREFIYGMFQGNVEIVKVPSVLSPRPAVRLLRLLQGSERHRSFNVVYTN